MEHSELLQALQRLQVETGSLACLGCGYEHSCSIHGCAILRAAVDELEQLKYFYTRVINQPDCNTCGNKGCGYKPKCGQPVRISCPLWHERKE